MQVLRAVALLALALLLAAPNVHGQTAGATPNLQENAKCPIKDRKRYDAVMKEQFSPNLLVQIHPINLKKWFAAPTTSALHQAAYVFDTPRVECLLTVAKIDPNLKVPFKDRDPYSSQTASLIPQWPLGAAMTRLELLYSTKRVTDEEVATIQALLKAGADPNKFGDANVTPLEQLFSMACDTTVPNNCLMAPGVLTIAKVLVSAGAKVNPTGSAGDASGGPLYNLVYGYNTGIVEAKDCKFKADTVYQQLVVYLVSQGADADYAETYGASEFSRQDCPELYQFLRKLADAQLAQKAAAAAAQKTSKETATQKKG